MFWLGKEHVFPVAPPPNPAVDTDMTERQKLIIELISKQDVRKWDVAMLVAWATAVADEMLKAGD